MSYLPFKSFTAAVPVASAATHTYTFQRPVGSLSSLSGYDINFSASAGTVSVSALVAGVLVSAVQLSTASLSADTIHLVSTESGAASAISARDITAGNNLVVKVAYVTDAVASDFVLTIDTHASAVGGEFTFVSATYTYGTGNTGSLPVLSATQVSAVAGLGTVIATLSTTTNVTTTLSSNATANASIADKAYLFQGDTFAFKTAVSAVSALDGLTNTVLLGFDPATYAGSRAIDVFLRDRRQGLF